MANTVDANEALWVKLTNDSVKGTDERAAYNLASDNADDTSVEQGFECFSAQWYACFAASYQFSLDTMTDDTRENWAF